jgi:NAD(P)-dependent dehydrogenase (short-subunit alcohol dehydrogenase family)
MSLILENKVAIVTGAGGETGSAIAYALAQAGARVAVNDINPDRAERAAAAIRQDGYEAIAITADSANRFQCVNLIESTREQWVHLDILVNNAAVQPIAPVLKMDEWAWQRCFDVNLKGAFFMSQLVGRVMADENQERGGVIINIASSIDDEAPAHGLAAYAASKVGLAAFSHQCASEFSPYGVRVHTVQPGTVNKETAGEVSERANSTLEIASAILRLCSSTRQSPSPTPSHR